MADEPLLNLETLTERPKIRIDGKDYEMLNADEISVVDLYRVQKLGKRIYQHSFSDEDDDEEGARKLEEMSRAATELLQIIMPDLPTDVERKLTDRHRMEILNTFTRLSLPNLPTAARATEETETS